MEPRPWSEDGATEIEKALLRAGRADGPSKGADLRLLATLQASPSLAGKAVTLTRWMKVGLIAVVAGGAAVVAHQLSRPAALAPSTSPMLPATHDDAPPPASVTVPARGPESSAPAREPESPSVAGNAPGWEPRPGFRSARKVPSRPGAPSLGDETRALDFVRGALDQHRPSQALRLLDEYHRKFPHGRLRPESMILRLAALVAADRHQAADSLASQLLADAAYEPYVPRIQSLLREAKQ